MRRQLEVPGVQTDEKRVYDIQDFKIFTSGCSALIILILGLYFAYCQIRWDVRIRTWDKVEGTIVRNDKLQIDERHTWRWFFRPRYRHSKPVIHTVSDIKYKYTYKGEKYYGKKIAYESDYYPDGKAGDHKQVIVNPGDPKDCAIISRNPRVTGFLRYLKSIIFFVLFLAFGYGPLLAFLQKRKRNRTEE